MNARDKDGNTALIHAAMYDTPENLKVLLDAGADVNARRKDGSTALTHAAGFGTPENLKVLLDRLQLQPLLLLQSH